MVGPYKRMAIVVHMVIPQLQRLGQEALKPKANLDYVETLSHRDNMLHRS